MLVRDISLCMKSRMKHILGHPIPLKMLQTQVGAFCVNSDGLKCVLYVGFHAQQNVSHKHNVLFFMILPVVVKSQIFSGKKTSYLSKKIKN